MGHKDQFDILRDIARKHNITFIDTRSLDNVPRYYLKGDGHYTAAGAKAMAELVLRHLKETNLTQTGS